LWFEMSFYPYVLKVWIDRKKWRLILWATCQIGTSLAFCSIIHNGLLLACYILLQMFWFYLFGGFRFSLMLHVYLDNFIMLHVYLDNFIMVYGYFIVFVY
jgi:hypothetical protein